MMNSGLSWLKNRFDIFSLEWVILFVTICAIDAEISWGTDLILWERLRIEPEIAVMETYDDNIYLSATDEEDDFITSVLPAVGLQYAFSPNTRVDLLYTGLFNYYKDADNFREDHHYGSASLQMESAKGSSLEIGGWGEINAIQPYTPDDRSKDYDIKALFTDFNLSVGGATDIFGSYQHSSRRFDDEIDRLDEYDRDFFAVGLVNSRSSLFPLLLEYRYEIQDNDENRPEPTEFSYQAAFTGFKWGQDQRLSGGLRVGYLWSEFNDMSGYDGWATDTDLNYVASPFTTITATATRGVRESTRAARDTLDYYIYAGAGLALHYTRLDPISLRLYGGYENRDYRSTGPAANEREDDFYIAGVTAQWRMRDWLSFALGYRYRKNESTIEMVDYAENRILAEVILFSTGEVRARRKPKSTERFEYF